MTVGLSVATMYGNVQNVVWLPWQPFKSRTLISWGLFVTTTRRNTELLVHNHMLSGYSAESDQKLLRSEEFHYEWIHQISGQPDQWFGRKYAQTPKVWWTNEQTIDPSQKSHNALDNISHNTPFCNKNVHTSVKKMVHCDIQDWCIVGFFILVYWYVTKTHGFASRLRNMNFIQSFLSFCLKQFFCPFIEIVILQIHIYYK